MCDPSELWVKHLIRWLDNGKRGAGWYKLKITGKAHFFVKLTQKPCPICGHSLNPLSTIDFGHSRPAGWLAAEDKRSRDDAFRAVDAERALRKLDSDLRCEVCGEPGHDGEHHLEVLA